jgi:hypothetical protein
MYENECLCDASSVYFSLSCTFCRNRNYPVWLPTCRFEIASKDLAFSKPIREIKSTARLSSLDIIRFHQIQFNSKLVF